MQQQWASIINPVVGNPLNNCSILQNVSLKTGVNVINHLLGQTQQGWFLVDKQGAGDIYRTAPFNALTLTLTASADLVVSIGVY